MNQEFGRKYNKGTQALKVHDLLPDTDPGNTAAANNLKVLTERFAVVAAAQRNGIVDRHAGAKRSSGCGRP